jgi:mono/diheme cytochrome c family protein
VLCGRPAHAQGNETGSKLFAAHCASCHGAAGGGELGPDIADVRGLSHWEMKIADLIKRRAPPMTYRLAGKQYFAVASGSNILAFGLPE